MLVRRNYFLKKKNIDDPKAGGTKLVYTVLNYYHKEFRIAGGWIPLPWPFQIKKEEIVVLRPYKERWDKHRNKLPRNFWGKANDPLTALWCILEYDYEDINKSVPFFKEQVMDHTLIKYFKKYEEEFSLVININH